MVKIKLLSLKMAQFPLLLVAFHQFGMRECESVITKADAYFPCSCSPVLQLLNPLKNFSFVGDCFWKAPADFQENALEPWSAEP